MKSWINKTPKRSNTKPRKKKQSSDSLKELSDNNEFSSKKIISIDKNSKNLNLKMNTFVDSNQNQNSLGNSKKKQKYELK